MGAYTSISHPRTDPPRPATRQTRQCGWSIGRNESSFHYLELVLSPNRSRVVGRSQWVDATPARNLLAGISTAKVEFSSTVFLTLATVNSFHITWKPTKNNLNGMRRYFC